LVWFGLVCPFLKGPHFFELLGLGWFFKLKKELFRVGMVFLILKKDLRLGLVLFNF
jgi:hypothetical protein